MALEGCRSLHLFMYLMFTTIFFITCLEMLIEKQEKHVLSCYNSADVCTLQSQISAIFWKWPIHDLLSYNDKIRLTPPPTHTHTYLSTSSSRAVVQEQGYEGTRASVQDQATLLIYSTAWLSRAWVENEAFIMKRRPHKSCIGIKLSH